MIFSAAVDMLCAKCHKNEATVHFTPLSDGRAQDTISLCPDWMQKAPANNRTQTNPARTRRLQSRTNGRGVVYPSRYGRMGLV